MFPNTLEKQTRSVLELLGELDFIKDFYLAGGTALALQLGHRKSIDLDFFCESGFSNEELKKELNKISKIKIISEDKGTLHIVINKVKISFLHYPYKLIFKKYNYKNIYLANLRDISCMKLSAISNRGSKKDFIDLYFILQKIDLKKILNLFNKKYKNINYNRQHILKSLVFFTEADQDADPKMLEKISWLNIKDNLKIILNRYLEK